MYIFPVRHGRSSKGSASFLLLEWCCIARGGTGFLLLYVNRTVPRWFPESLCVLERGNAKRYKLAPQRGVPVHYVILSRRRKTITTSDVCREWLSRSRRVLPASNARESTLWKQSANNNCCNTECFSAIDTALHSITHWIVTSLLFTLINEDELIIVLYFSWNEISLEETENLICLEKRVKIRPFLFKSRFLFFLEWNLLFWNEIHSFPFLGCNIKVDGISLQKRIWDFTPLKRILFQKSKSHSKKNENLPLFNKSSRTFYFFFKTD